MTGRILALDPGTRRIGVAVSDPGGSIATPLEVIESTEWRRRVPELVAEYRPRLIIVGLPLRLGGGEGPGAEAARRFADEIARLTSVPVELVDERFTTRIAEASLLEGGVRRRDRRRRVDKVAAAVLLQGYLAGRPS